MRDYKFEFEARVNFIKDIVKKSGVNGIIFGNSGGKDCALVGILCKAACENTVSVKMPCDSKQNYGTDTDDANALATKFNIENRNVDLTEVKKAMISAIGDNAQLNSAALTNIPPRLRMTTLYAIAAAENRLVAGTGNRSEYYMGYFTKWGDGGYDFNPIFDLTVTEVYEFLEYLGAPENIIKKSPSAGLYDGQTDEKDMGVTYAEIDKYIESGEATPEAKAIIDRYHSRSAHKRTSPKRYGEEK